MVAQYKITFQVDANRTLNLGFMTLGVFQLLDSPTVDVLPPLCLSLRLIFRPLMQNVGPHSHRRDICGRIDDPENETIDNLNPLQLGDKLMEMFKLNDCRFFRKSSLQRFHSNIICCNIDRLQWSCLLLVNFRIVEDGTLQ